MHSGTLLEEDFRWYDVNVIIILVDACTPLAVLNPHQRCIASCIDYFYRNATKELSEIQIPGQISTCPYSIIT